MAKILILIGAHLCTAPRPQKEATALTQAGHEVTVAGVWFNPQLIECDRTLMTQFPWQFYPVLNFAPGQNSHLSVRLQAKTARILYRYHQYRHPALLGYGARSLLRFALAYQADFTIVHSEAGMWAGTELLKRGYSVGVDFEDWFSQDLLPTALAERPVSWLAELEAILCRHCAYRLTTSQALATALAEAYQSPPPTVIYNVFPQPPTVPLSPLTPSKPVKLHWFSQTLGPGRGLETLFLALPYLQSSVEIHLRGHYTNGTQTWLKDQIPNGWESAVYLHPLVPAAELPSRIADYDIGLALEQTTPPSRNLTLTNKLFQYLQSGLALIATATAGQQEILASHSDLGGLVPAGNPQALAQAIDALVLNPRRLQQAKLTARQMATTRYRWEQEQSKLVAAAQTALSQAMARSKGRSKHGQLPTYTSALPSANTNANT
jgi:glycosyltransferase involved in cell wall biosynthesis